MTSYPLVTEPKKCGTNKKPGRCVHCEQMVPAGAGDLYRGVSGWMVMHKGAGDVCHAPGFIAEGER